MMDFAYIYIHIKYISKKSTSRASLQKKRPIPGSLRTEVSIYLPPPNKPHMFWVYPGSLILERKFQGE
jgi:hypothetical protein